MTSKTLNDSTRLASDHACVEIRNGDGALCFLASGRTGPNLLSAPVAITLTDVATGNTFPLVGPADILRKDDTSHNACLDQPYA